CNVAVNDASTLYSLDGWSSKEVNETVKSVKPVKSKRGCYTRRSSWTSSNITSYTDDGHSWRKYGQKEIINATHKRNYYRCTHKFDQGCQATKQVQKIEDEPPKYKITYNRHHSCNNFLSTPQIILDSTNDNDTSILLSFENNGPSYPLDNHEEPNDGFSSLDSSHNQVSSFDYNQPRNLIMPDFSRPVSQISSKLDHGDVISTGVYSPIYEMGHMFNTIDCSETAFNFSQCELTDLYYFLSTLHFLNVPENSFDVLKDLENSLEVLKVLEDNLESMKLQENLPVDGLIPLSIRKNHVSSN
ncbi:WRKY domain-containing protein, partial [Tanacetum coccineum]